MQTHRKDRPVSTPTYSTLKRMRPVRDAKSLDRVVGEPLV